MIALASTLTLLAGCAPSNSVTSTLPTVPTDIQVCFRQSAMKVPEKALTVAEVESLWKQDRVKQAALRRCGQRLITWYESIRRGWK